ncbi:ABC transporter permease [Rossellomorea marisflavi]|uniref:ABC transporter permease n=1 Tax=Rossellomorea marisflavi TaxID=189381 RepID=UPI00345D078F
MKQIGFYSATLLFFLFPVCFFIYKSFFGIWRWGEAFPVDPDARAWKVIAGEGELLSAVVVSVAIAVMVLILNLLIGLTAGKAFALHRFRGKVILESMLMMPLFLPALVVAAGLQLVFIRLGLADTWLGVAVVHLIPTVPYSIKLFKSAYEGIGTELIEQSMLLGGGAMDRFRHIELPQLIPAMNSVLFLTVVISLGQYVLTAIIGGGSVVTLSMIYYPFTRTADESVMSAFSLMFMMIPLITYLISVMVLKLFIPYRPSKKRRGNETPWN